MHVSDWPVHKYCMTARPPLFYGIAPDYRHSVLLFWGETGAFCSPHKSLRKAYTTFQHRPLQLQRSCRGENQWVRKGLEAVNISHLAPKRFWTPDLDHVSLSKEKQPIKLFMCRGHCFENHFIGSTVHLVHILCKNVHCVLLYSFRLAIFFTIFFLFVLKTSKYLRISNFLPFCCFQIIAPMCCLIRSVRRQQTKIPQNGQEALTQCPRTSMRVHTSQPTFYVQDTLHLRLSTKTFSMYE